MVSDARVAPVHTVCFKYKKKIFTFSRGSSRPVQRKSRSGGCVHEVCRRSGKAERSARFRTRAWASLGLSVRRRAAPHCVSNNRRGGGKRYSPRVVDNPFLCLLGVNSYATQSRVSLRHRRRQQRVMVSVGHADAVAVTKNTNPHVNLRRNNNTIQLSAGACWGNTTLWWLCVVICATLVLASQHGGYTSKAKNERGGEGDGDGDGKSRGSSGGGGGLSFPNLRTHHRRQHLQTTPAFLRHHRHHRFPIEPPWESCRFSVWLEDPSVRIFSSRTFSFLYTHTWIDHSRSNTCPVQFCGTLTDMQSSIVKHTRADYGPGTRCVTGLGTDASDGRCMHSIKVTQPWLSC